MYVPLLLSAPIVENTAFKNTNTIQQYTKPKMIDKNQDYNKSGIYKLTCNTCKMSYIGQTIRKSKIPGTYMLHQEQWPPICLRTAYPTKFTWIRIYYRHYVPIQTIYSNISSQWKSPHRTRHKWTKPIISVGHRHHAYVSNLMKTKTDQHATYNTLKSVPTLQR